jgi:nitrite reductase (NADH) small subunit
MQWQTICDISELTPNLGAAALVNDLQIALFLVDGELYAINNHDPFSQANVMSRGIVGDQKGELCVSSPIYKQHFSLKTGQCLEDQSVVLASYPVRLNGSNIELQIEETAAA